MITTLDIIINILDLCLYKLTIELVLAWVCIWIEGAGEREVCCFLPPLP